MGVWKMLKMYRVDTPRLLHHIIIRGIEFRKFFNDNKGGKENGYQLKN
jgi:hypothetical protein